MAQSMAGKKLRENSHSVDLKSAIALLINNQAAFVAQETLFLARMAKVDEDIAKIFKELELIKAVLVKHEQTLERLPEAIREKIGFKS